MAMQYGYFVTNDNVKLAYQTSWTSDNASEHRKVHDSNSSPLPSRMILLLHGFSGSSDYFVRNTPGLAQVHWIVAPDMRGHGRSGQPSHGYHVARLAMDLYELIRHFRAQAPATSIYAVGCSIGAAVLWTYVELFTDIDFAGLVFVDQAPLQNRSAFGDGRGWDGALAHYECFDEATMLEAQACWASKDIVVRENTYKGLVESCLGYRYKALASDGITASQTRQDEEFFTSISRACNSTWLARLLGDHTSYDHREAIDLITKPVLVIAGRRSGCFSIDGMMETARRVQARRGVDSASGMVFESGHWLFWEEPDRFNQVLLDFVNSN